MYNFGDLKEWTVPCAYCGRDKKLHTKPYAGRKYSCQECKEKRAREYGKVYMENKRKHELS